MRLENVIEVSNLTKYYRRLLAVDHINFKVKSGEIFGFLGPNGAGKTTTIRLLSGLTKPSSGVALVAGLDVTREPIKMKEQVGVVPEVDNLYDEMTAWNNLMFVAKLYGVPKADRAKRSKKLLKLFGLYDRHDIRLVNFSKGMKRRLTIVAALVHNPKILFLDEPTTGLDVQSSRLVRALIRKLNDKGVTVFLTTHYIEEADQLCDRVAIINRGKIVATDIPGKLKSTIQEENVIEVSFGRMPQWLSKALERLDSVGTVARFGDKFKLYVNDPSEAIPSIVNFAKANRLRILSINTLKPSLEDAFVKFTGVSPEVMTMEREHVEPARDESNG